MDLLSRSLTLHPLQAGVGTLIQEPSIYASLRDSCVFKTSPTCSDLTRPRSDSRIDDLRKPGDGVTESSLTLHRHTTGDGTLLSDHPKAAM
jgi:hypothetical protein